MASVVADTHIVIWLVTSSPRLSAKSRDAVRRTIADGSPILLSAVSVAELIYATEKMRLPQGVLDIILDTVQREHHGLKVVPFDYEMAETMRQIPRDIVPDLPDRMIAATSLTLGIPLITADEKIRRSGIPVIW
jgi:PIN domain nuclease of toxin-antitoxin system